MSRCQIKVTDFVAEAKRRFGDDPKRWQFVCPMCGTVQSANDFYATGQFKPGTGELNKYLGFSCIGRFTGQGDEGIAAKNAGKPWDKGCNWTLGGLFQTHSIELVGDDGKPHPHFDLAPAPGTPNPLEYHPSPEELHILQHSLGVDKHGQGRQYRNAYVVGPGSDGFDTCQGLARAGLMRDCGPQAMNGGMHTYTVTDIGRIVMARDSEPAPKLTAAQKRYRAWLNEDCGMPFGEWLQRGFYRPSEYPTTPP